MFKFIVEDTWQWTPESVPQKYLTWFVPGELKIIHFIIHNVAQVSDFYNGGLRGNSLTVVEFEGNFA